MADKRIPDAAIRRVWLDPRLSTTEAARKGSDAGECRILR